ncbi:MAG: type II toxin-antitoxin system VapB family antitoxin [Acidimicrobiales bacterium]
MIRRTTIELDDDLLRRAMRALGTGTKRATVEEALRRVSEAAEADDAERRERIIATLKEIGEVERSQGITRDEMWR